MLTEKCLTLPKVSSFSYSTTYCPPPATKHRIREIKNRLHSQKKILPNLNEIQDMKLLDEDSSTIRTYSLYDVQDRIDYFEKKKLNDDPDSSAKDKKTSHSSSETSSETLQSVIANTLQQTMFNHVSYGSTLSRTMMNSKIHDSLVGKRRSLSSSQLISSNDQKRLNRFYPSLSKRVRSYSLSNHAAMAIPPAGATFNEEQNPEQQETNSNDFDNTYFYPEETTRLDDGISLTTITSNLPAKIMNTQHDVSVCSDTTVFHSDTEENSEGIKPTIQNRTTMYDIKIPTDAQHENIKNNEKQIRRIQLNLTPLDDNFTGVVHAKKCTVIEEQQSLSDYNHVNHRSKQGNKIRSNIDDVSLNTSMTSFLPYEQQRQIFNDEQLNQYEKRTNENEYQDNVYCKVNPNTIVHSIKMINDIEPTTQQETRDDLDEHYSDDSHYSDDLRYSSDAARNSCASDDLNNTSSTLRQEAISITRVRCKRRKTWIRTPTSPTQSANNSCTKKPTPYIQQHRLKRNLFQPFLSNNQVDGTDACQNASVNSTTTTKTVKSIHCNQTCVNTTTTEMLLHNNSLNSNNSKTKNGEIHSYNCISLNNDYHSIKTDESQLSKTTSALIKDAPSAPQTNNFYPSSLSPVKRLLNDSVDSNIEIIQMDEQECILEIVDGVLTIVPKEKSTSSSVGSDEEKNQRQKPQIITYNSPPLPKQRSSSIASSASTPSLSEHEPERDDLCLPSSRFISKPFIIPHDVPIMKTQSPPIQPEPSTDILDLYSAPFIPTNNKVRKSSLDESLSSLSSGSDHLAQTNNHKATVPRSSSPINNKLKSSSIKDTSPSTIESQTRSNKNTLLTQLLETVKKASPTAEKDSEIPKSDPSIPKREPLPVPKPINKDRIKEFASLLSGSVHLSQPQTNKNPTPTLFKNISTPTRSEDQPFVSKQSSNSDREDRESYPTVKSSNSEQEQKRHIDARYNDKLDDRGSINVKTANIKALFEQKISEKNKALSQSSEHLFHCPENKSVHRKIPISYTGFKRSPSNYQPSTTNINNNNYHNKRNSLQDPYIMNKINDHIAVTKDVVIEDKQYDNDHHNVQVRRNSSEQAVRSGTTSSSNSPVLSANGNNTESLLAREIRQAKEKEEEWRRQRKKCGFNDDVPTSMSNSTNDTMKFEPILQNNQPVRSSSFLSNLDFFASKANGSSNDSPPTTASPRRSIISVQNIIYDSHSSTSSSTSSTTSNHYRQSSNGELKQMANVVSQELNRFNENGISSVRNSSTNGSLPRSSSNQNINGIQNTNNIIQREIEAIRAKEAELRQLGRIQHTSDEHADPRKYQEIVPTLPKSQSISTLSSGKFRRDSDNQNPPRSTAPLTATQNGFLKSKANNNNHSPISSIRGKFPSPNPTAPIVCSANNANDFSKLSSIDRLELEKRQCQEREQELRKQRYSISASISSNTTINGDSGNASQEEHDDEQERYFDKIERIKRTQNEKAHAPIIRPTKRLDMSQKWEQMMANKTDD